VCLHLNLNTKLIDEDGVLDKRVIIFEDALLYIMFLYEYVSLHLNLKTMLIDEVGVLDMLEYFIN